MFTTVNAVAASLTLGVAGLPIVTAGFRNLQNAGHSVFGSLRGRITGRGPDITDNRVVTNHTINLTEAAANGQLAPVLGRDDEILDLASQLTESAVTAVVGPSGIGKSALLRGLALKIQRGEIPTLQGYTVLQLQTGKLLSGSGIYDLMKKIMEGGSQEVVQSIVAAVMAYNTQHGGKVILALDEAQDVLAGQGHLNVHQRQAFLDALKNELGQRGANFVVFSMDAQSIYQWRSNPGFSRRIHITHLREIPPPETMNILQSHAVTEGGRAGRRIQIEDGVIQACMWASETALGSMPNPQRSLTLFASLVNRAYNSPAKPRQGNLNITMGDLFQYLERTHPAGHGGMRWEGAWQADRDRGTRVCAFSRDVVFWREDGEPDALRMLPNGFSRTLLGNIEANKPSALVHTGLQRYINTILWMLRTSFECSVLTVNWEELRREAQFFRGNTWHMMREIFESGPRDGKKRVIHVVGCPNGLVREIFRLPTHPQPGRPEALNIVDEVGSAAVQAVAQIAPGLISPGAGVRQRPALGVAPAAGPDGEFDQRLLKELRDMGCPLIIDVTDPDTARAVPLAAGLVDLVPLTHQEMESEFPEHRRGWARRVITFFAMCGPAEGGRHLEECVDQAKSEIASPLVPIAARSLYPRKSRDELERLWRMAGDIVEAHFENVESAAQANFPVSYSQALVQFLATTGRVLTISEPSQVARDYLMAQTAAHLTNAFGRTCLRIDQDLLNPPALGTAAQTQVERLFSSLATAHNPLIFVNNVTESFRAELERQARARGLQIICFMKAQAEGVLSPARAPQAGAGVMQDLINRGQQAIHDLAGGAADAAQPLAQGPTVDVANIEFQTENKRDLFAWTLARIMQIRDVQVTPALQGMMVDFYLRPEFERFSSMHVSKFMDDVVTSDSMREGVGVTLQDLVDVLQRLHRLTVNPESIQLMINPKGMGWGAYLRLRVKEMIPVVSWPFSILKWILTGWMSPLGTFFGGLSILSRLMRR